MSNRLTTADKIFLEVSPPGREPQVRALKGKVDNPYAVAWASYGASKAKKKRKKEANSSGGLPQTLRGRAGDYKASQDVEGGPGSGRHPSGRTTPMHPKTKLQDPKSRGIIAKALKSYRKMPGGKALLRRTQGMGPSARYEADKIIFKMLLKESVEYKSYRFSESALMEVVAPVVSVSKEAVAPQEGPMVKCVLITEGLGNRADMHYYGPECIRGGVALFEGQPCFIDHQKRSDQQDQPERTVRDKCGYFKNVRVEDVNGKLGLCAELHYDLSETGRYAYDKACTAIHYKEEFPDSDKEYVGLSIAADGKLEERVVQVGDEVLDVKYVTEFTAVGSVDEVTSPARGGRFVQVIAR